MPKKVVKKVRKRSNRKSGTNCPIVPIKITHLGKFFEVCSSVVKDETYWFRGHTDIVWDLTPSALRYKTPIERDKALELLTDFKRFGEIKLFNLPSPDGELKWIQLLCAEYKKQ